ncbi:N-formylglutamate amidohydrolase [Pseudogemmobacter blasticus]|uniref:N-formylglutamate amidohydrolase n=1 Tax=Fuscovulum blasticum DSM 2131 TaxID=1188250 RepID=A0A2T4JBE8_FUSBL|nr:N-formylglutamate amidohydrolase [Fuscovulum blasticum]PTE15224.1 N-formylglutamate amidohydrolase [Fuscovulum blasticum DSM 2131]
MPEAVSSAVYTLRRPRQQTTPVVFASPHSGADYRPEFMARSALDRRTIRSSEDAFVDRLFDLAPQMGAPLLAARVPRAYIDLNRAPDELDPAVIEGLARAPHNPRIASGLGVIPRVVAGGRAIYSGKLPRSEAEARIRHCWQPYHTALAGLLDATRRSFGEALLIDCHSMPHEALDAHTRPGLARPDVVLGDRFGTSAGPEMMDRVEAAFAGAGLRVARNAPFAGAYIAQTYGRPGQNVHVVQVEIDRALYMDEVRIVPTPGFAAFRALMAGVMAEITAGLRGTALPLAAE